MALIPRSPPGMWGAARVQKSELAPCGPFFACGVKNGSESNPSFIHPQQL